MGRVIFGTVRWMGVVLRKSNIPAFTPKLNVAYQKRMFCLFD